MYASIFGNVNAIYQRLYAGSARYHAKMRELHEFVHFHKIPKELWYKLESYIHYVAKNTESVDLDARAVSLQCALCCEPHLFTKSYQLIL